MRWQDGWTPAEAAAERRGREEILNIIADAVSKAPSNRAVGEDLVAYEDIKAGGAKAIELIATLVEGALDQCDVATEWRGGVMQQVPRKPGALTQSNSRGAC